MDVVAGTVAIEVIRALVMLINNYARTHNVSDEVLDAQWQTSRAEFKKRPAALLDGIKLPGD